MTPGSSVWFSAVRRGGNDRISDGENRNVPDGAVLHSDDDTPVTIGRNCLIGAGALVWEGKEISDNSPVIGAPGRVVRTLTDNDVQLIAEAATVANRRRRAATMTPAAPASTRERRRRMVFFRKQGAIAA